ncbi:hypothetical protein AALC25_10735, partial [Lachnospiraceae bacterium 29-84]
GAGCGKAARPVLRGVSPARDLPTYQSASYETKTLRVDRTAAIRNLLQKQPAAGGIWFDHRKEGWYN